MGVTPKIGPSKIPSVFPTKKITESWIVYVYIYITYVYMYIWMYVIISIFMYITLLLCVHYIYLYMKQLFNHWNSTFNAKIQDTNTMLVWFQLRYRRWHWYYESFGNVPPKLLQFRKRFGRMLHDHHLMSECLLLQKKNCPEQTQYN